MCYLQTHFADRRARGLEVGDPHFSETWFSFLIKIKYLYLKVFFKKSIIQMLLLSNIYRFSYNRPSFVSFKQYPFNSFWKQSNLLQYPVFIFFNKHVKTNYLKLAISLNIYRFLSIPTKYFPLYFLWKSVVVLYFWTDTQEIYAIE